MTDVAFQFTWKCFSHLSSCAICMMYAVQPLSLCMLRVCVCFVLRRCYVVNETLKSKSFCVIFVCLSPSGFMHLSHSFSESPCLLVSFSLSDMGRWPSSINHLCIHSFCLSLSCVNTSVRCWMYFTLLSPLICSTTTNSVTVVLVNFFLCVSESTF